MLFTKSFLLVASVLASLVEAAPIETVVEIVTNTHWVTVDCVSTVWLPINQSPITTATTVATTSSYVDSISTTSSTSSAFITTSTIPVPTTTSVYVAPTPSTTSSVYVAPVIVTTPATSSYIPPTTSAAPVQTTPQTTAVAAAVVASTQSSSSTSSGSAGNFAAVQASSSNTCEGTGSACVGEVTHYDGGLGACGWNVDTSSDMAVALPVGFMGSKSNGNPYCGRSITIYNPTSGTTAVAKVGDKCMGCVDRAIDLTDALFKVVTDGKGDGRVGGIQWWFN